MLWFTEIWITSVIILAISIFIPFINYLKCLNISKKAIFPSHDDFFPSVTILLPVKNEAILIKNKLSEIINLDYPKSLISILIINSGSTDGTFEIAKDFLNENCAHVKSRIENLEITGKSYAINKALDIIETDIFIMMDTESQLNKDCINKLLRWFANPEIGGVCGRQMMDPSDIEFYYRSRFNTLRIGESLQDSTPIFEGSICSFRKSCLEGKKIDSNINADDSQLAMIIRDNNFKAIMDPEVLFFEPFGNDYIPSKSRKIRRAQGLSRVFWKNRRLNYTKEYAYSIIFFNQFYFHIIFPWLILLSFTTILFIMPFQIYYINFESWNLSNFAMSIPFISLFFKTPRNLLEGCMILSYSHLLLLNGKKLNIWNIDNELRKLIKKEIIKNEDK